MKKDLIIIGAGDFGKEVAWLVERINKNTDKWNLLGFVDDNEELYKDTDILGYPFLGKPKHLSSLDEIYVICAIGNCKARFNVIKCLDSVANIKYATLIDPRAILADTVQVGEGTIITAGAIITPDAKVGNHVIINLNATVGHDTRVGDYCTIHPGCNISGKVSLDNCVFLGTGTKVLQGIKICDNCIIGAGAVVAGSIEQEGTYVGVPCKKIGDKKGDKK